MQPSNQEMVDHCVEGSDASGSHAPLTPEPTNDELMSYMLKNGYIERLSKRMISRMDTMPAHETNPPDLQPDHTTKNVGDLLTDKATHCLHAFRAMHADTDALFYVGGTRQLLRRGELQRSLTDRVVREASVREWYGRLYDVVLGSEEGVIALQSAITQAAADFTREQREREEMEQKRRAWLEARERAPKEESLKVDKSLELDQGGQRQAEVDKAAMEEAEALQEEEEEVDDNDEQEAKDAGIPGPTAVSTTPSIDHNMPVHEQNRSKHRTDSSSSAADERSVDNTVSRGTSHRKKRSMSVVTEDDPGTTSIEKRVLRPRIPKDIQSTTTGDGISPTTTITRQKRSSVASPTDAKAHSQLQGNMYLEGQALVGRQVAALMSSLRHRQAYVLATVTAFHPDAKASPYTVQDMFPNAQGDLAPPWQISRARFIDYGRGDGNDTVGTGPRLMTKGDYVVGEKVYALWFDQGNMKDTIFYKAVICKLFKSRLYVEFDDGDGCSLSYQDVFKISLTKTSISKIQEIRGKDEMPDTEAGDDVDDNASNVDDEENEDEDDGGNESDSSSLTSLSSDAGEITSDVDSEL